MTSSARRPTEPVTAFGFDVFDVHHHVGRAFDALGGALGETSVHPDEVARIELANRLRIMDEGGVHQALVIPGHGYLRPNGIADTRRVNDEIAAYRDATPIAISGRVRDRRTPRRRRTRSTKSTAPRTSSGWSR